MYIFASVWIVLCFAILAYLVGNAASNIYDHEGPRFIGLVVAVIILTIGGVL